MKMYKKMYENLEINKKIKNKKYYEVRDHCHYKAQYRGAACSIYNLKYSAPKKFL